MKEHIGQSREFYLSTPLTKNELVALLKSTSGNLRDRALIFTILATRSPSQTIRELTKKNIRKTSDESVKLVLEDRTITLPNPIAQTLTDHAKSIKSYVLFATDSKVAKSPAMTRQNIDTILKRHSARAGIRTINLTTLVTTSKQILSTNTHNQQTSTL